METSASFEARSAPPPYPAATALRKRLGDGWKVSFGDFVGKFRDSVLPAAVSVYLHFCPLADWDGCQQISLFL